MVNSQEIVRRYRHNQWDVEHLLLALLEQDALKQAFRPEFLNRIDETIVFDPLTQEQIEEIVGLMAAQVQERLAERQITFELTSDARHWLAQEGYDPTFGARPLRRAVQRYLENPMSKAVLGGEFQPGDHVMVDTGPDGLAFRKAPAAFAVAAGVAG
jgi:ATP-dependent Clp protease ATP-binding subunit ClpA